MDPSRVETFPEQSLSQELPIYPIVHFLKVQLKKNSREFLRLGLMNDLLEGHNPFKDVASLNERILCMANSTVSNGRKANRISLSYKFEDHVDKSNRPKLTNVLRTLDLRN
jgi:hypothetical protein